MLPLLTVLIILALVVYLMFFWIPGERTLTESSELAGAEHAFTVATSAAGTHLTAERCWYGVTFHGYQDEYCLETQRPAQDALNHVRGFFKDRKARILLEEPHHLRFLRGRGKIAAYLTGLDTWFPQEIDVSLQIKPESTVIALQYRVPGFHVRIPPNQLRREVLELRSVMQIPGAEPTAPPNGGPAPQLASSGVTEGPPSVS